MDRIIIIGSPGSGKTTFALKLSEKLKLPLVHLDHLGWCGNWEATPIDEFDQRLAMELTKPKWIIEGNYDRTLPLRLQYCNTVIYMDLPRLQSFGGVLKRDLKGYGKICPDMGGNCPEKIDFKFLKSVWIFNRQHRKNYYSMLNEQKSCKIMIVNNHRQAEELLRKL